MSGSEEFSVPRRTSTGRTARAPRRVTTWTTDGILDAIRRWARRYGAPPIGVDWEPARARRTGQEWRAERFEQGDWPTAKVVAGQFGTFNAGVEAAGLRTNAAPARQRPGLTGPEAISRAMLEWTRRYGDVPTMADWDPARARRLGQDWRIARYYTGDWPSARAVALHFGSFTTAIQAAGLTPRPVGVHHDRRVRAQAENRLVAARASVGDAPPGSGQISEHVRAVARARRRGDPVSVHAALIDLAGAALAWAGAIDMD